MAKSMPQRPEHDIEAAPQQPVLKKNPHVDGDKSSSSDKYKGQTYEQRLYEYVKSQTRYYSMDYLDFHDLAQMNILRLMGELAKYDEAMRKDKRALGDNEHVGDLLHRYTTAVQDLGYWSRLPKNEPWLEGMIYDDLRERFPGVYGDQENLKMAYLGKALKSTSGPVDPLRRFVKRVVPFHHIWTEEDKTVRLREGEIVWSSKTAEVSPFVDTLARFIVAITGGLSLVIPMLVMRLGETLPKSLTTVSVAVVLFSALTSLMFRASNVETLGATAAYAAVLVVFVGTSK